MQVELVVGFGADVNLVNREGDTPLHVVRASLQAEVIVPQCSLQAVRKGQHGMVQYLIEHGADPHISNCHGHTCVHITATTGAAAIARTILDSHCDVSLFQSLVCVEIFIVCTKAMDPSALDIAIRQGHRDWVQMILRLYPEHTQRALSLAHTNNPQLANIIRRAIAPPKPSPNPHVNIFLVRKLVSVHTINALQDLNRTVPVKATLPRCSK
jgi:ankyrin repeat protein